MVKLALKKLLPYATDRLNMAEPVGVVRQRLAAQVEPVKLVRWHFSRDHLPYAGQVLEASFDVRRIIHYRNSFLPQIKGRFTPLDGGTVVEMTYQLHPLVLAFLAVWGSCWCTGAIPLSWVMVAMGEAAWPVALLFTLVPLMGLAIIVATFHSEVNQSRRDLTQIMLGQRLG